MALEMKVQCEKCQRPLEVSSDAYICSYECTFCPDCTMKMAYVCPNCQGELIRRPTRRKTSPATPRPDGTATTLLSLDSETRRRIWSRIIDRTESYFEKIR